MTIAQIQFEGMGVRSYVPEGPFGAYGNFPALNFKPGSVVAGDGEGEFVYVLLNVVGALTLNQGDWIAWDGAYMAYVPTTSNTAYGDRVGTFFLGGIFGNPVNGNGSPSNAVFSYTFPTPGIYGIWVQRAGMSLMNVSASCLANAILNTTATAGQMFSTKTTGTKQISKASLNGTSTTFTANTTNGSTTLTNVSSGARLEVGMTLSGTGIATGSTIQSINGSTIVMSLAATATGSGVTVTATNATFYCTTTNGSPTLTNVTSVAGIYPNQTITGTGISGTVISINGNPGNYTITMSANCSATANSIQATASGYLPGFLNWPSVDATN